MAKLNEHTSDEVLLQRIQQNNDAEAKAILLTKYTGMLLGVSMKYLQNENDAYDMVQHIFEKLLLPNTLQHEITYFKSYLYSIAKNECLIQLRKNKTKPAFSSIDEKHHALQHSENTTYTYETEHKIAELENAIKQLPFEQQVCVEAFYLNKKSYQNIAESNNFTIAQVKSYIQNGKRNLKNILSKNFLFTNNEV